MFASVARAGTRPKRHDNVKRTIETLVERGVIASPQIEEKPTAGRPAKRGHNLRTLYFRALLAMAQNGAITPARLATSPSGETGVSRHLHKRRKPCHQ